MSEEVKILGKNLFETYEVNCRQYTDNLGDIMISVSKKQYIEYEQQKEEIERLNNIINELTKIIVQCKDEIQITTYRDMNNSEKWETKMLGYIDILNKVKEVNKE